MTTALLWLALTCMLSAMMWIPYIVNAIVVRGFNDAFKFPKQPALLADWAIRLRKIHCESAESLTVFGMLVLTLHVSDGHTRFTESACILYFWSRFAHAFFYAFRVRVITSLAFAMSWLCILVLGASLLT